MNLIKKFLKRFKRVFPSAELERELIPLKGEEIVPKTAKKKKPRKI